MRRAALLLAVLLSALAPPAAADVGLVPGQSPLVPRCESVNWCGLTSIPGPGYRQKWRHNVNFCERDTSEVLQEIRFVPDPETPGRGQHMGGCTGAENRYSVFGWLVDLALVAPEALTNDPSKWGKVPSDTEIFLAQGLGGVKSNQVYFLWLNIAGPGAKERAEDLNSPGLPCIPRDAPVREPCRSAYGGMCWYTNSNAECIPAGTRPPAKAGPSCADAAVYQTRMPRAESRCKYFAFNGQCRRWSDWTSAWPECCPGLSDCPPVAPHCGDGKCSPPGEDPVSCTKDCGPPAPVCGDGDCSLAESISGECPADCPVVPEPPVEPPVESPPFPGECVPPAGFEAALDALVRAWEEWKALPKPPSTGRTTTVLEVAP